MPMQEKPHRKINSIYDEVCDVLIEQLSDIIESEVENRYFIGNDYVLSGYIPLFLDGEDVYYPEYMNLMMEKLSFLPNVSLVLGVLSHFMHLKCQIAQQ